MEPVDQQLSDIWKAITQLQKNPVLVEHQHNGLDSTKVLWSDLYQKKVWIHHTIQGISAATAGYYGVFFIVPFTCVLTGFKEVHQTLGTDAGAVTVTLEKLTGTQALDAGAVMLASALSLKAAVNTVQTGTLTATNANRNLAIGNRLALKDAGTLTAVANVTVMVELQIS